MTTFEQLAEDLSVMSMKISLDGTYDLNRYSQSPDGTNCRGVSGCTGCMEQCPKGVEICEINRCLGYAYGYGDIELAHENYRELSMSSRIEICDDCDECLVKCVNGLNLTESVSRARKLFA